MDLNKLSTSDKVVAGSGLLLFIAYFLPWFKVDFDFGGLGGGTQNATGADVGFLWATLPMLIGLALAGSVIASKLFDAKLPELPVPWGQVYLGLGGLAAVLVTLKLLIGEDPSEIIKRAFGLFIATIAALGLAAGGFLKFGEGDGPSSPDGGSGSAPF